MAAWQPTRLPGLARLHAWHAMTVATFVVVTAYGLQWFFNCVWESEGSGK